MQWRLISLSGHTFTTCKSKNLSKYQSIHAFIRTCCLNVGEKLAIRDIVWLNNGKGRGASRHNGTPPAYAPVYYDQKYTHFNLNSEIVELLPLQLDLQLLLNRRLLLIHSNRYENLLIMVKLAMQQNDDRVPHICDSLHLISR